MLQLVERVIDELNYNGFVAKQRYITNMFPTFYDRVKRVNQNGGVKMIGMEPQLWKFEVASGTKPGVRYKNYVEFVDILADIRQAVLDKRNWNSDNSGVDFRKLAQELMHKADLKMDCECVADLYWAGDYIRTQRDAKFGDPENRRPTRNNVRMYGVGCKHMQSLMDALPFYTSTMASYLKKFYGKEISQYEAEARKTDADLQKAASFLQQRQAARSSSKP